jgi:hypothetical protein
MFGPSVKSVPGWWVSIVPILIGLPVAATPGLGPHDEMSTEPLDELLAAAVELPAAELDPAALLLLLLLLLPHPARAMSASAARSANPTRIRGTSWWLLTYCLLSSVCEPGPGNPSEVGRY